MTITVLQEQVSATAGCTSQIADPFSYFPPQNQIASSQNVCICGHNEAVLQCEF